MTAFKDRIDYIRQLFAPETPEMVQARGSLDDHHDRIHLPPEEGKLLQLLSRMISAKRIVEIGTLGGYSALWLAQTLPDDGEIITIEKDPKRAAQARKNLALAQERITLIEGVALDVLPDLTGPFDMVFIDADKLNYLHYLDWAEQHVRRGGLIIGDNTFLFDAVWKSDAIPRVRKTARAAMQKFNQRLADSTRYHAVMLPTAAGMTIAQKIF